MTKHAPDNSFIVDQQPQGNEAVDSPASRLFEAKFVKAGSPLGDRIRLLRLGKGYTMRQLGELAGVSAASVFQWENGRSVPRGKLLPALARGLGVSIDALLGDSPLVDNPETASAVQVIARARRDIALALSIDVERVRVFIEPEEVAQVTRCTSGDDRSAGSASK